MVKEEEIPNNPSITPFSPQTQLVHKKKEQRGNDWQGKKRGEHKEKNYKIRGAGSCRVK